MRFMGLNSGKWGLDQTIWGLAGLDGEMRNDDFSVWMVRHGGFAPMSRKYPKNYSGKHAFHLQLLCGFLILDVSKYCNTSNI